MNDEPAGDWLDARWARRAFDRAARGFDAAAILHANVRGELLERLNLVAIDPKVVLDAGAATGHVARALGKRYSKALVLALDSSLQMLRVAAAQRSWRRPFARLCADAQRLPLRTASVDLIVSNLMLQWCDPDAVFAEFRRVLSPQGLLCFSTLGPDTLRELRRAWRDVDSGCHVGRFLDMHDLGDALVRAGFAAPVLDVEHLTLRYLDFRGVAADLKGTGAHNASAGRAKGLTGRRKFAAMQSAYERFRENGRLPATYEVVFGHAWAPLGSQRVAGDGSVVTLEEMKRQLRAQREP